jgi:hypothetical protein
MAGTREILECWFATAARSGTSIWSSITGVWLAPAHIPTASARLDNLGPASGSAGQLRGIAAATSAGVTL